MAATTNKTTTPASTTVKVSSQTGAAKDELFAGISEDSSTQILNILANDPGSAALWSIDQNALNAAPGSQQPQALNSVVLASGATLSANPDGTVTYQGAAALQSLAEGELANDSFIYTIRMANGALSTAKASVQIVGKNDAATFGGDTSGALTEDDSGVTGKLTVNDVDHDQSAMQAGSVGGAKGALTIDAAGNWSYGLTSDMNYLQAGESVIETLAVKSVDGTSQDIVITINGVNDVAAFGGNTTGSVQEDGVLNASGVVTVDDLDHDQSAFASTGSLAGTYGDFTFDLASGAWTYSLRNADANVQALITGQTVNDKLALASVDGSTSEIVISIGGKDDTTNPADKWNVNKENVTKTGGGLDSQVAYDINGVARIAGFDSNDELHPIGAMKFDSPFQQLIDTNNDSIKDSTLLNFSYKDGNNPTVHVDVILVGYITFTADQLKSQVDPV